MAADPRVGSYTTCGHEPCQGALGHIAFFLPEAGKAIFLIKCMDGVDEVGLNLGGHSLLKRYVLSRYGVFPPRSAAAIVAAPTRMYENVVPLAV